MKSELYLDPPVSTKSLTLNDVPTGSLFKLVKPVKPHLSGSYEVGTVVGYGPNKEVVWFIGAALDIFSVARSSYRDHEVKLLSPTEYVTIRSS